MAPLVSVIISCYNHVDYVGGAIKSVLNQSYGNIELIVTDDGSSDGSVAVIDKLAKEHDFVFIKQENKGLSWSLNNMIFHHAKGKYVAGLGSDDLMFPERIATQVAYMEQHHDVAVTGGNMVSIDGVGERCEKQKIKPARTFDFDDLFWKNVGGIPAPTNMVRLDVFKEVGGYDPEVRLEDLYMWLKIACKGHKLHMLEDNLSYYRVHETSTHSDYRFMIDQVLKVYDDYRDHPKYKKVVDDFLVSMLVKVSPKDPGLAKELLAQVSFVCHPMKVIKSLVRMARH